MPDFKRYAIYWAPEAGSALARFGAAWFGWDAETATEAPRLPVRGLPAPVEELTATARRYGFHATLKPPFPLATGETRCGLEAALEALVGDIAAFDAPALELRDDLGFPALRPQSPCRDLDGLAARCVTMLDRFRAPPLEAELQRRRAVGLSAAEEANLIRWGYPYVLDAFRFHVTLTPAVAPEGFAVLSTALAPHLDDVIGSPLPVREVCLFGDPGDGQPFHLLSRHALCG